MHAPEDARARLLAAAVAHVERQGIGDLSLRELAAAIGTSHRMLIYHFGSKRGLMAALVRAVEAEQRAFLARLAGGPAGGAAGAGPPTGRGGRAPPPPPPAAPALPGLR